jgi:hypothetical protein
MWKYCDKVDACQSGETLPYSRDNSLAHEGDEKFLNDQLNELSGRYRDRLSEADQQIADLQQELQNLFEQKPKLIQNHQNERLGKEPRAASLHEQMTRHHQEHKLSLEQQSDLLGRTLLELTKAHEEEIGNSELKLARLTQSLITELQNASEEKESGLAKLQGPVDGLNGQLAVIAKEEEKLQAMINDSTYNDRLELQEKTVKVLRGIQREIKDIKKKNAENSLKMKEEEVAKGIVKLEEEHVAAMNDLKNEKRRQVHFCADRLFLLKDDYQKKIETMNNELLVAQEARENLLNKKEEDLTNRRNVKLQRVGVVLRMRDSTERSRVLEVSDIMKKLEEQQNRLGRLHADSLLKHDSKRSEELARLRKDHEDRPAKVLFELEKQAQLEFEEALRKLQAKEDAKHSTTLAELVDRIEQTKRRIRDLQTKIDGLASSTSGRMEFIMELTDVPHEADQRRLPGHRNVVEEQQWRDVDFSTIIDILFKTPSELDNH